MLYAILPSFKTGPLEVTRVTHHHLIRDASLNYKALHASDVFSPKSSRVHNNNNNNHERVAQLHLDSSPGTGFVSFSPSLRGIPTQLPQRPEAGGMLWNGYVQW